MGFEYYKHEVEKTFLTLSPPRSARENLTRISLWRRCGAVTPEEAESLRAYNWELMWKGEATWKK